MQFLQNPISLESKNLTIGKPLYLIETEKTVIEIQSPVKRTIKSLAQIDETYDVGIEITTIEVDP